MRFLRIESFAFMGFRSVLGFFLGAGVLGVLAISVSTAALFSSSRSVTFL